MNRLLGTRCYLAGPMDRALDGGEGWRNTLTPFLSTLGVVVLNPCEKPIALGRENQADRNKLASLKSEGKFDEVAELCREIRTVDLRMVDVSDFLILNLDTQIHMCGSYEELTLANRQKKPVLIHCEAGKADCPNWVFGMIPHTHIFDCWESIKYYLIDVSLGIEDHKRWVIFDLYKQYEEIFNAPSLTTGG